VPEVPASSLGKQDGFVVVWGVWGGDEHKVIYYSNTTMEADKQI
jgi:hypothetical protein